MKPDPTYTYYGKVTDTGEIKLPGNKMRKELAQLAGHGIEVTIKRRRKRRSDPQNRYYWGVVIAEIATAIRVEDPETGWTAEMVHEVLKERFLPLVREWREYVNKDTDEAIREPLTTTKLTTVEQEIYHEHCRKFAAEFFGITIALPNEQAEFTWAF